MIRFCFKKGLRFKALQNAWTMIKRLANGKLQFEDEDGILLAKTEQEVHLDWMQGKWSVDAESLGSNTVYVCTPRDVATLPEHQLSSAKRRLAYLSHISQRFHEDRKAFTSSPKFLDTLIEETASEIGDDSPPHSTTVWRWWRKYSAKQCIHQLVDRRGASARTRLDDQRQLFEAVLDETYLKLGHPQVKDVVDALVTKIKSRNKELGVDEQLRVPGRATIYRWIDALQHSVVLEEHEGKKSTKKKLRRTLGRVTVKKILDRFEIDHTPVDLLIIDKVSGLVLGRPWLTLIIDRRSRMIVGFYVGFNTPSAESIMYALRMAILPKNEILTRFPGIRSDWPAHGIPKSIICDNGMDLHASDFEQISLELGIEIVFAAIASPQLKGAIERVFGTVARDLFHKLPGTVFSSVGERGDYPSEETAALDITDFTKILLKWIVDVYHQTPHRGLAGQTPLFVWQEDAKEVNIQLPADPSQLHTLVGSSCKRTVFHYGVQVDNLFYNSEALASIADRSRKRPRLLVRHYLDDVSYVSVFDPLAKVFVDVPAIDLDYTTGLNRHTHGLIQSVVKARFKNDVRQEYLREVKAEIKAMVKAATRHKKMSVRKKAAKFEELNSEQVLNSESTDPLARAKSRVPTAPKPPSDLPPGENDDLMVFDVLSMEVAE